MKKAFSLVELSIVLVILGLLVGGVLSGQSLIRAAELRAVTTEYQRYFTAVQTFRGKYFAIPGDITNATAFWGFQGGTGCTNRTGAATISSGTCDGDGSGIMGESGGASATGENYQLWRQLALAGLIEGSYSGMAGPNGSRDSIPGTNQPVSKLGNGSWWIFYDYGHGAGYPNSAFAVDMGNIFGFGARGIVNNFTQDAILKPVELWNIDTKIDDGMPSRGKVLAELISTCTTTTDMTNLTATYLLNSDVAGCAIYFINQY